LLQHADEYAVEVELTRGQMGEIRPLPPEDAWRLARELDLDENRYPRGRTGARAVGQVGSNPANPPPLGPTTPSSAD
jgi:hypothetical protein